MNCHVRFFGGRDAATYALLPDHFDFLTLTEAAQERELEHALVKHIRDFLMELGLGFAFLGSQYPLVVSGKEYRLDLLFVRPVDLKTNLRRLGGGQMIRASPVRA